MEHLSARTFAQHSHIRLCHDLASKHKENTNLKEFLFKLENINQYESLYSSEIQCYRFWCSASVPRFEGFHFLIFPKIRKDHSMSSTQVCANFNLYPSGKVFNKILWFRDHAIIFRMSCSKQNTLLNTANSICMYRRQFMWCSSFSIVNSTIPFPL